MKQADEGLLVSGIRRTYLLIRLTDEKTNWKAARGAIRRMQPCGNNDTE